MTATPIAVLQKAADMDLKLGFKPPDTLTMEAARRWPREFRANPSKLQAEPAGTPATALLHGVFTDSR